MLGTDNPDVLKEFYLALSTPRLKELSEILEKALVKISFNE